MKRTLSFCLLSAALAFGAGLLTPSPARRRSDPGTLLEEVSAVNVIHARKLAADLDADPSPEAAERAYRRYKTERIEALREVYRRRGEPPPPSLRGE